MYCRFDSTGLEKAARDDKTGLARYLRFLTTENYFESPQRTIVTAREASEVNPECLKVIDARCRVGGVENCARGHVARAARPRRVAPEAAPGDARRAQGRRRHGARGRRRGRGRSGRGLAAAKDPSEMSWAVLGRLAAEAQFVHDWRRVAFMHDAWRVPVGDELDRARPELEGHPYRRFVESYGYGPGQIGAGP